MLLKKYLPFIVLIAAIIIFVFIKQKQRGHRPYVDVDAITVPAVTPSIDTSVAVIPINRNAASIIYSRHARCRMECRFIDESEVKEILAVGKLNEGKIQKDNRGTTYPLEGVTHDKQHVRIVFAPKANGVVEVVTCIDLDKDWPCDCR